MYPHSIHLLTKILILIELHLLIVFFYELIKDNPTSLKKVNLSSLQRLDRLNLISLLSNRVIEKKLRKYSVLEL